MKKYSLIVLLSITAVYSMEQRVTSSDAKSFEKNLNHRWNRSWEKAILFGLATTCFCCADAAITIAESRVSPGPSEREVVNFNTLLTKCTIFDPETDFFDLLKIQAAVRAGYIAAIVCCFEHEKPDHSCCCSAARSAMDFYCCACDSWTRGMGWPTYSAEDFDGIPGPGAQLMALSSVRVVDTGKKRE